MGRPFNLTKSVRLEPVFEVFNLTKAKNIRRPSVTNLIFNFDGTVQTDWAIRARRNSGCVCGSDLL